MADFSDFLSDDERQSLERGVSAVRRAEVLVGLAQLAAILGEDNRVAEVVDTAREKVDGLSAKRLKKLSKHIAETTVLLGGIEPKDAGEESIVAVPDEVVAVEAQPSHTEQLISRAAQKYLEKGLGENWWQELGIASAQEATPSKVAEIMMRGVVVRKPVTIERVSESLERYLAGESLTAIAAHFGVTDTAVYLQLGRIRDQRRWQEAGVSAASPQPAAEAPVLVAEEPEPQVAQTAEIDIPALTHHSLSESWSGYLGLSHSEQAGLREFLDPAGSTALNNNKRAAVTRVIEFITDKFGTIDNPDLMLDDIEKVTLRQLTGAWYQQTNGQQPERPLQPLALLLRKTMAARPREMTVQKAFGGMYKVLAAGSEERSPVVPEKLSAEQANQESRESIMRRAIERPSSVSSSEWEELAHEHLLDSISVKLSDSGDEQEGRHAAEQLWARLHFDDDNVYKAQVTDVQRSVLKKMAQRFAQPGVAAELEQLQKTVIRTLCNMSNGVNTLDDVLTTLQKKDPKVTKSMAQRYAVDAVVELLRDRA